MQDINIRISTILNTSKITQASVNRDENIKKLNAKINAVLDTSKIRQSTLNKDGKLKSLEVKIKPVLDNSASSVRQFQSQINQLAKLAKVTLKVDVDTSAATQKLNNIANNSKTTKNATTLTPIQQRIADTTGITAFEQRNIQSARTYQKVWDNIGQEIKRATLEQDKLAESTRKLNYQTQSKLAQSKYNSTNQSFFNNGSFDTNRFNQSLGIGNTTGINAQNSALANLFNQTQRNSAGMSLLENRILRLNPAMRQLSSSTQQARQSMSQLNTETQRSAQSFLSSAKKFAQWMAIGTLIMQPIRALKEGIGYIVELDNSMNEVRIVTGKTQEQVESLATSYNRLAKEMSVTTSEIAKTSADLYRQGLGDSEVEDRMKGIIEYAKISSISLEDSNKIITATANATGESITKITDLFAYLGDKTASGADEIGESLQRVASAAENSGLSIEKTASWLATISSITRESSSTIGRSLNSAISRYESIKSTGFNSEDDTSLNDVVKSLSQVGIVATDSQGQLRNYGDVLDELGAKYKTLTKNEQAYVVTTMFGTFQRNRGVTLLNNYSESLKNYELALNSAGQTEQKFNIYQESTQAHIDSFKTSMENLWQSSFDSDMFKGIIDGAAKLIDTLNELVNNPITAFIAVAGVGALAGKALAGIFVKLGTGAIAYQIALFKMSVAQFGLTTTTNILTASLLASPLFWGAVAFAGIYAIITAIDYLTVSFKEQQETVETLSSSYQSITSDISSINSELETTQSRLAELNSQGTLTVIEEDEKRKLEETNSELERQLRIKESLERIKKAELQKATIKLLEMESETIQTGNKVLKQTGAKTAQMAPETKSVTKLESVDYNIEKLKELEQAEKDLQAQQDNLNTKSKDYDKTNAKLGERLDKNNQKQDEVKTYLSETTEYLSKQAENLDTTTDAGKNYKDQIDDTIVSIDEMINGLSTDKMPDWYDKNVKANKDMVNHFKEDYDIDLNNYDNLADAKKDIELLATQDVGKILDGRIAEMNAKYNVDVKNYANATEAKIKMEQALLTAKAKANAKENAETAKKYKVDTITGADGGVKLNSSQKKELSLLTGNVDTTSDYQSALDEINKVYGTYKATPTGGVPSTSSSDKDSKSTPSAIDSQDMSSAFLKSANAQAEIDKFQAKSIERQIKIADSAKDYTKELELQETLLDNQNKQIADYLTANQKISNEATRLRSNSTYGEQSKSWFDVNGESTAEYIQLLESFAGKTDKASKAEYQAITDLYDNLYKLKQGWYDNVDAVNTLQDAMESTRQSMNDVTAKMLEVQQKSYDSALKAVNKVLDDNIKKLEKQKTAIEEKADADKKAIDAQITGLEAQKDAIESANKATQDAITLEQLQDNLANAKSQQYIRQYSSANGWQWVASQAKIQESQKALDDFKNQQKVDNIQKEIDALQKKSSAIDTTKDIETKAIDEEIKKYNEYKDSWADTVNSYSDQQDRLNALQTLGSNWEKSVLDGRIENVRKFTTDYEELMARVAKANGEATGYSASISSNNRTYASSGSSSGGGSSSSSNNATATIPGVGTVGVNISSSGKTTTTGLPSGTVVHTGGGDVKITGGTGGNYTSEKIKKYGKGSHLTSPEVALVGDSPEWIIPDSDMPPFIDLLNSRMMDNMLNNIAPISSYFPTINNSNNTLSTTNPSVTIQNMTVYTEDANDFLGQMTNIVMTTGNMKR